MHADSLFEWDSGFFSHLELGFPLSARRKAPSQPSVPKLKVPQFFHLCPPDSPHSKWACLCPGVGNVGCKSLGARLLGPPLTAQGDAPRDIKCGGEGGRPFCAPRALTHPAIGFLREPGPQPAPLPGAAIEFPGQAPSLAPLSPPAGALWPGPHCPSPSPGCPVAT